MCGFLQVYARKSEKLSRLGQNICKILVGKGAHEMKQKNASLTTALLVDFGQAVCESILCDECPQKGRCSPWRFQPEVMTRLAEWYLGKFGYFKVAK